MLVNRPSAFIFQQIILPYIVSARVSTIPTTRQRHFSSSSSATRPFEGQLERDSRSTWEVYPSSESTSGSRRRTREYLELEVDGRHERPESSKARKGKVEVDEEEEAYKRTAALAMERIIQSHQPMPSGSGSSGSGLRIRASDKGKGKGKERANLEDELPFQDHLGTAELEISQGRSRTLDDTTSHSSTDSNTHYEASTTKGLTTKTTTSQTSTEPTPSPTTSKRKLPFPPLIHQLLQARQFRLASLHILNLPLYAMDEALVEKVALYMERHNGGKAAGRLRKGKAPSPEERRLMSDHNLDHHREGEGGGEGRLPVNYWSLARSSRPPPRTLDDVSTYMPGIELTPTQKFTAFCNLQLAHITSTDPSPGKLIPPKSLKRPNSSLRQLSTLLDRIYRLETHRGFIPDRVTANIILSTWLRCSLSPLPVGQRINHTKSGWKVNPKHLPKTQIFGKTQLRGLFDTISRLIDRSILKKDQSLNHTRHVQPFVRMLSKGFEDLGDQDGWQKVKDWDKVVKKVLLERQAEAHKADKEDEKDE
jgi:hypothetical protein